MTSKNQKQSVSDTTFQLPTGTIVASLFSSTSIPSGWLPCDGSEIPVQYTELIALVGSAYTPNLIGRTLIGAGVLAKAQMTQTDQREPNIVFLTSAAALEIGDTGGECQHQLSVDEMPAHTHTINGGNFGVHKRSFEGDSNSDLPFETEADTVLQGTDSAGGDGSHFNVQPYFSVTYIIYAVQT